VTRPRAISIVTHQYPEQTGEALRRVLRLAERAGVEVRLSPGERQKHALEPGYSALVDGPDAADLAVVLGGDGTILAALREHAGTDAPVLAVNYGEIGFLSTVDREDLDDGVSRALDGRYETLPMPALTIEVDGRQRIGVNDISFHRRAHGRVAQLQYRVRGEELGDVRCDGLVAATPVGSTGYNLANGGPILAWGVAGFVVSFIAPHTLTARALVVAPADTLTVRNLSDRDEVDMTTDGRDAGTLAPRASVDICFAHNQVLLAQLPGSTFYHRFRDKFGRLAY
jgi:NAD+ kinase